MAKCPGCGELLYETHSIAPDGSQSTIGKPPRLLNDGEDYYITCSQCVAKVVMLRSDTSVGTGLRPSHVKS